jgi:hypothetical protein
VAAAARVRVKATRPRVVVGSPGTGCGSGSVLVSNFWLVALVLQYQSCSAQKNKIHIEVTLWCI